HRPAWQCKSVDFLLSDNMEFKGPGISRRDCGHELLAEVPYVLCFRAVVRKKRHLLIRLCGGVQAQSTLGFFGHVRISWVGEFGATRLRVHLIRKESAETQQSRCECTNSVEFRR